MRLATHDGFAHDERARATTMLAIYNSFPEGRREWFIREVFDARDLPGGLWLKTQVTVKTLTVEL